MKTRTDALAALVLTGILAGGLLGALTNAVNGKVSSTYFINIMGWSHLDNVWRASIAQGVFEGLLFGSFFSLVFTAGVGWISRVQCPYITALRYLGIIVVASLICWCVGGLAGMGLAALSPEFYRSTFHLVPDDPGEMIAYAWVGGSIWGEQLGGLIGLVLGLVVFRAHWRGRVREEDAS